MLSNVLISLFILMNEPDYKVFEPIKVIERGKEQVEAASVENAYVYYQVPLSDDLQKYIQDLCYEKGISYELMLALAYTESRFDPKAISWDGSSMGLFQINKNTTSHWLAVQTEIKNVDVFNPYHSSKMATWYVAYLKDKYLREGYDEESVTKRILLAYRFGVGKSKGKSLSHSYVREVLNIKYKLESGEGIND